MKKSKIFIVIIIILIVTLFCYKDYKEELKNGFIIKGEVESVSYNSILLNVEYSSSKAIIKEQTPVVSLESIANPKQYKKGDKLTVCCGDLMQPTDPPVLFVIDILD